MSLWSGVSLTCLQQVVPWAPHLVNPDKGIPSREEGSRCCCKGLCSFFVEGDNFVVTVFQCFCGYAYFRVGGRLSFGLVLVEWLGLRFLNVELIWHLALDM